MSLFPKNYILFKIHFKSLKISTTTYRSNLSKLLDSKEVGRAFTILSLFQGVLPFATRPFYAFLYKQSLATFPAAFRVLTGSLYLGVLGVIVFTHLGLKRTESKQEKSERKDETCCSAVDGNCGLIRS